MQSAILLSFRCRHNARKHRQLEGVVDQACELLAEAEGITSVDITVTVNITVPYLQLGLDIFCTLLSSAESAEQTCMHEAVCTKNGSEAPCPVQPE